ncbi:unnamed protein product, partial [Didymodactylos carnosus]
GAEATPVGGFVEDVNEPELLSTAVAALAPELPEKNRINKVKCQVEMPPPPSPASSTCSVDSSASFGGL